MRIGHGYDVHRFAPERKLILGGVEIPWEMGLLGHSDADVLCHALMDAMLGAAGLPDIGRLFPDNDPSYKGADSIGLLEQVAARLAQEGYRLANADCTIVAQKPKMAPHIPEMKRRLSLAAGGEEGSVNVKATTEEGLGFTGEGLGIAAHAVVLMEKIK